MKHKSIWNKLSKKELVHILEMGLVDDPLGKFMETRNAQLTMELQTNNVTCWECKFIAAKLGLA